MAQRRAGVPENGALPARKRAVHMAALGIEPVGGTSAQLAAVLRADVEEWTAAAKSANIKTE